MLIARLILLMFTMPALAQVYEGCETPSSSHLRTITLDGSLGKTFEDFAPELRPGDHVILSGKHGRIYLNARSRADLAAGSAWIRIEGKGAEIGSIDLRGVQKIEFTNIKVSSASRSLVMLSEKASHIVLRDSIVEGGADSSNWTLEQWLAAPSGFKLDNGECIAVVNNKFQNLRHGISIATRAQVSADSSAKALVHKNIIRNLSGDFMRPLASDVTLSENLALDGYVSAADGDLNHDDFIQGFAYPLGIEFSNVKILKNYFQATTNPSRKFNAPYQGISVFDGYYTDFIIRQNTVLGSAYHGIAMYGGKNGLIENNTILSIDGLKKFRISVVPMKAKSNYEMPENVLVRNNISNILLIKDTTTGVFQQNNETFLSQYAAEHFVKFDMVRALFDLNIKSTSPLAGRNLGASSEPLAPAPAPVASAPYHPNCEAPATSFKRQVVLDAAAGETLDAYFGSGQAQPGDHIIVKGHQGSFSVSKYSRPDLASNPSWIKIESQGASFSSFTLRDISRIQVIGVDVNMPGKGSALSISSSNQINVSGSSFVLDPSQENYFGARIDSSSCVGLSSSHISGARTGLMVLSRADSTSPEYQMNVLLKSLSFSEISRNDLAIKGDNVLIED